MAARTARKVLLALDGGGMRGAFTLGVLGELETLLASTLHQDQQSRDRFVLADWVDYIGGTSTGAIIAAGLSLGWKIDRLKQLYRDLGEQVFRPRWFLPSRAWSKYPDGPLREALEREFGSRTFGDSELRTLLLIVMHDRTTDSPYPLSNNPPALYNLGDRPTRRNLEQRLSDLLWASTAAPAFFPPREADLRRRSPRVRRWWGDCAQQPVAAAVPGGNAAGVPAGLADREG